MLRISIYDLILRHTFTISRSAKKISQTIIVEFEHENVIGYGEASPSPRYNESIDTIKLFYDKLNLDDFKDPLNLDDILCHINKIASGNYSAKAGIDIALHDWFGKKEGVSLWKKWKLQKSKIPITSFTIGIDSLDIISQKIAEAEKYPILKVKLGVDNDLEIISKIRKLTDKPIRVDANEGWKIKEEALQKILWLEKQNIEFIEQPMPSSQLADIKWLHDRVKIPFIADESVSRLEDINKLIGIFDGINIKLMKAGGLREAIRMIGQAKEFGLKIMLGCMIETSIGISAAAQLLPLADYADLDGNLLITNDPFEGVKYEDGILILSDEPGLGVRKRT